MQIRYLVDIRKTSTYSIYIDRERNMIHTQIYIYIYVHTSRESNPTKEFLAHAGRSDDPWINAYRETLPLGKDVAVAIGGSMFVYKTFTKNYISDTVHDEEKSGVHHPGCMKQAKHCGRN